MSTPNKDLPTKPSTDNHNEAANHKNPIKLTEPTKEHKKAAEQAAEQKREKEAAKQEEKDSHAHKREFTVPRPRD